MNTKLSPFWQSPHFPHFIKMLLLVAAIVALTLAALDRPEWLVWIIPLGLALWIYSTVVLVEVLRTPHDEGTETAPPQKPVDDSNVGAFSKWWATLERQEQLFISVSSVVIALAVLYVGAVEFGYIGGK